ncbi:hypothetical protein BD413DRAFT_80664 [Trametes elegans]|nr:hypothetical protein BD413DRAFT_80664 [Trametes elegans]
MIVRIWSELTVAQPPEREAGRGEWDEARTGDGSWPWLPADHDRATTNKNLQGCGSPSCTGPRPARVSWLSSVSHITRGRSDVRAEYSSGTLSLMIAWEPLCIASRLPCLPSSHRCPMRTLPGDSRVSATSCGAYAALAQSWKAQGEEFIGRRGRGAHVSPVDQFVLCGMPTATRLSAASGLVCSQFS